MCASACLAATPSGFASPAMTTLRLRVAICRLSHRVAVPFYRSLLKRGEEVHLPRLDAVVAG
jgi:hypothetical protein